MKTRFPFTSFPNSWYRVAFSHELPPGGVKPLHYFGKDLVVFRTEDGTPHVFDAHCPHLGAHLGYGGKVKGKAIQCPFHGWCFNGNGECMDIPYSSKIPPKAQIHTWPVHEVNGCILVYYHAHGEPPTWKIPELPNWNSKEWTSLKQYSYKIRTHVQDTNENAADTAHLIFAHGIQFTKDILVEDDGSIFTHQRLVKYKYPLIRKLGIEIEASLEATIFGLGLNTVHVCIRKSGIKVEFLTMTMTTPIDENYNDLKVCVTTKKLFSKVITDTIQMMLIRGVIKGIQEDIPIWENKAYCNHPLFCHGDQPINKYRMWCRQFY